LFDKLFGKKEEMEGIRYMEKMEKYCVFCLILLFLLFPLGAASAKTITVDDSGSADFTKIQDAVNVACDGDTIIVKDGTYAEDIKVNKSLTIQSENGTDRTIVKSRGLKFNITADEVEIVGFTITGVESLDNAGIKLHNVSGCEIADNNIINNYEGVALISSSNNYIVNNTLTGGCGRVVGYERGVILISSSNNYIINNTIEGNEYGLALSLSHHNFICFNDFANSRDVFFIFGSSDELSRNNYWNSPYKIKYIYKNKEIENYVGNHWVFWVL
jgi:parallel beta-helix repeat protein